MCPTEEEGKVVHGIFMGVLFRSLLFQWVWIWYLCIGNSNSISEGVIIGGTISLLLSGLLERNHSRNVNICS